MNQNQSILEHLVNEHILVLNLLDSLNEFSSEPKCPPPSRIESGLRLLDQIHRLLEVHHLNEEELLFPALQAQASLRGGGPRCGLFMTHLLLENLGSDFLEKAKALGLSAPKPNKVVGEIVEMNSPLMIPLREHWAGQVARDMMLRYLSEAALGRADAWQDFVATSRRFERMMRLHVEKEDTCLFVIAESLIPKSTLLDLATKIR